MISCSLIIHYFVRLFLVAYFFVPTECTLNVYETFETPRSRFNNAVENRRNFENSSNQKRSAGYEYREIAETEFHRSGYIPVPYVVGGIQPSDLNGDLRSLPIPNIELNELIRQHISHQRKKFLRENGPYQQQQQQLIPSSILQGVTHITELRQTPYRRFSDDRHLTYEEKRRRWKAELKKRIKGPKIPPRPIDPPSMNTVMMHNDNVNKGEDRYYVTYSPQTQIYQISPRPPPNFRIQDLGGFEVRSTEEPLTTLAPVVLPTDASNERVSYEVQTPDYGITEMETSNIPYFPSTTPLPPFVQLDSNENEEGQKNEDSYEYGVPIRGTAYRHLITTQRTYLPRPELTTSTTPSTTTTTTKPPPIIVVKEAEPIVQNRTFFQQIRLATERPSIIIEEFPTVKQILHLDDYYQEMDDVENDSEDKNNLEEGNNMEDIKKTDSVTEIKNKMQKSTFGTLVLDESYKVKAEKDSIISRPIESTESDLNRITEMLKSIESEKEKKSYEQISAADGRILSSDNSNGYTIYGQQSPSPSGKSLKQVINDYKNNANRTYAIDQPPIILTTPKYVVQKFVDEDGNRQNPDEEEEEDDDDEDLFFWKPEPKSQQMHANEKHRDTPLLNNKDQPFQIETNQNVNRL